MAKIYDFQWQIVVPEPLSQGNHFDRWEEVSSCDFFQIDLKKIGHKKEQNILKVDLKYFIP